MPTNHLILCGGAKPSTRKREWTGADTVSLDVHPHRGNINLKISDITTPMAANLPDEVIDLLEIAAYVYCADQATGRGGKKEFEYGRKWRRRFRFELPVRKPSFWSEPNLLAAIQGTLGFLSDDDYEFCFTQSTDLHRLDPYLEFDANTPAVSDIEEVLLFSGGLDSFGGAVQECLVSERKVALVSHRPVSKIDSRQRQLVSDIADRVADGQKKPCHVPVWINKDGVREKDYTQRSRSFLYASIGAVVAHIFDVPRLRFYENGVTSLNLPISAQAIGGRASRTTHPRVLNGFSELFSLVFGRDFTV